MTQDFMIKKSLIDQIIEETLISLKSMNEFDAKTIEQLMELAARGDLKNATQIAEVIKPK